MTRNEWIELLLPHSRDSKQARYRSKQIFNWIYQRQVTDWDKMTDVSKELRAWLKVNVQIPELERIALQNSEDGTRKYLWRLPDGKTVESVVIPATKPENRFTACISSQVGCAMGCRFCLTGTQKIERNLTADEIVAQVVEMRKQGEITNIVFMGSGEPLLNLDEVVKACEILLDQEGMNFSKRRVTVSTCGIVPKIGEMGKRIDVSLAVSLNATTDETRSYLMPINRKYPIQSLLGAMRKFPLSARRKITIEYVLIDGVNSSLEDAGRLVKILKGIPTKINLIPFNEHERSDLKRPSDKTVQAFQDYLVNRNQTATLRKSRGRDISAACGQLKSRSKT